LFIMLKRIISSVLYGIVLRVLSKRRGGGAVASNSIAVVFLGNLGDFFVFCVAAELLLKKGYTMELVCRKGTGIEDVAKQTGLFKEVHFIDNSIIYRLSNLRKLKKIKCRYAFAAPISRYVLNDIYTLSICAETHILPDMMEECVSMTLKRMAEKKAEMLVPVSALWEWDKYTDFLCGSHLISEKVLPNTKCITKKAKRKYIAVFPGASVKEKMWPAENFVQVIKRLSEKSEYHFYIMGNKADEAVCAQLTGMLEGVVREQVWNTSVNEAMELLEGCCLAITNDSGSAHMALYKGVPFVAICGMWQNGRFYPNDSLPKWCVSIACEQGVVACENCGESIPNCTKHQSSAECLRKISVDRVFEAAMSLLDAM